jgi:periplasmic protein TonB
MRRSFTLFSVVFHAIAISAALIAQVLAVGALPTPHQPILFDASAITAVEIHVPPPPRRAPASESASASINAAPIVAPDRVADETGREHLTPPPTTGLIAGVESGPPSSIDGVGVAPVAPPPPPDRPVAPVRVGAGIRTPIKTVDAAPLYPAIARSAHVQGVVILEAVLDATGRVDEVRVLRSIPLLDQAAIDAVRQWRYTPTLLNGRAIPIVLTVTVNFQLQ